MLWTFSETDECASSPCQFGSCTDGVDGYTCDCDAAYEGVHCDISTYTGILLSFLLTNYLFIGLILGLHPANERRRYFVTMPLIGWAQAYNWPSFYVIQLRISIKMVTVWHNDVMSCKHYPHYWSFVRDAIGQRRPSHWLVMFHVDLLYYREQSSQQTVELSVTLHAMILICRYYDESFCGMSRWLLCNRKYNTVRFNLSDQFIVA